MHCISLSPLFPSIRIRRLYHQNLGLGVRWAWTNAQGTFAKRDRPRLWRSEGQDTTCLQLGWSDDQNLTPYNGYAHIRILVGHDLPVTSIRYLRSGGNRLASASRDASIRVWDIATGYCVKTIRTGSGWIYSLPTPHLIGNRGPYRWQGPRCEDLGRGVWWSQSFLTRQ